MIILTLLGLLALVATALAEVNFNLVGFPTTSTNTFAVEIDKKLYPLKTSTTAFPLWSGVAPSVSTSGYRYVQVNSKGVVTMSESFQRRLSSGTTTPNEFFGRQTTFTSLPSISQVYKDVRPKSSKAFDDSQVATIHLTVDPAALSDMLANPLDSNRKAIASAFKFINGNTIYSVGAVKLKISGKASRKYNKVSLSIKFDSAKGETFFDRPAIKLRAEATDPSMIREKLYIDLLNSAGVVTCQGSYVRVYANGKALGFFLMVEDLEEPFLMSTVHQGQIKDVAALGSLYKLNAGPTGSGREASLRYQGSRTADYSPQQYDNKILGSNPKTEPMQQLIALMKDLQDWNPASAGGIAYWSQRVDLEGYQRAMVIEYLTGAWDLSWWRANNYYMYYNPLRKVWQFLPTDYDHTFSDGNRQNVDTTYKLYGQRLADGSKPNYPMVNKLIYQSKDANRQFENYLLTITKAVFNNKALDGRIDAYVKQIELDVAWDYAIDRSQLPGKDNNWTSGDFIKSINSPVKGIKKGLKPWINGRAASVPGQISKS